jgi:hypothetical protein
MAFAGCMAKDTVTAGIYFSADSFKNNSPSRDIICQIIRRTLPDLQWNGGNDYKVEQARMKTIC